MRELTTLLREGASALGLDLPERAVAPILRHVELLLKWNPTVNLTAIVDPGEVIERHVLDSLAIAPYLPAGVLLDAGSGGGFPGIPVRILRPDIEVLLVDSAGRKVAFLKSVLADLRLHGARALQARLAGAPAKEGVPLADVAVARAFAEPAAWLPLGARYTRPGGIVLFMAGKQELPEAVDALRLLRTVTWSLPFSKARRRPGIHQADP